MSAKVISINIRLEAVWKAYLSAKETAERTGTIADGIAAGHAWRRWLDMFISDDQKRAMDR